VNPRLCQDAVANGVRCELAAVRAEGRVELRIAAAWERIGAPMPIKHNCNNRSCSGAAGSSV
jgi:hypothetical protein